MQKKLIIVKLGGSVVTHKERSVPSFNSAAVRRLAKELAVYVKRSGDSVALVHGAGSFGHPTAKKFKLADVSLAKKDKTGVSITHNAVYGLAARVAGELIKAGLPAFPLSAASLVRQRRGRIATLGTKPIEELLRRGYIPQLYGDMVVDNVADFSICSGDQIAAKLAEMLKPNRIVFVTDVDGVYTDDPKKDKSVRLISEIGRKEILKYSVDQTGSEQQDVTGLMYGKLKEIADIKCDVSICNGLKAGIFLKCLNGKKVGTKVGS